MRSKPLPDMGLQFGSRSRSQLDACGCCCMLLLVVDRTRRRTRELARPAAGRTAQPLRRAPWTSTSCMHACVTSNILVVSIYVYLSSFITPIVSSIWLPSYLSSCPGRAPLVPAVGYSHLWIPRERHLVPAGQLL